MKGLDIAKNYYLTYGKEMLEAQFPKFIFKIAVGLVGEGSECFGYDDIISADHDFEPGFCLWVTQKDYDQFGFELERSYSKLPKEYEGFLRSNLSPVGGDRRGVMVIDDFYNKFLGTPSAPQSLEQWLYTPSAALAVACNGEVWKDELGEFSKIRETLLTGYPKDVKLKKLAAHLTMMLQTGLYNYPRCISRNENGAAQLSVFEFVKHTLSVIYLLNDKYEPFYKWVYKGMRNFRVLSRLENSLVSLTELGNSDVEAAAKIESIEEICQVISKELKNQGFIKEDSCDLQKHALYISNSIKDVALRNMHVLEGI